MMHLGKRELTKWVSIRSISATELHIESSASGRRVDYIFEDILVQAGRQHAHEDVYFSVIGQGTPTSL